MVDGVSLTVAPGELVALLGPNGAGKTTTVEIIEGYRRADAGTVRVLGEDPARGGRALRARVGLMLQAGGIDLRARPRETIRQYARFHADPRDPDELLDVLGLRDRGGHPVPPPVRRRAAAAGLRAGPRRPAGGADPRRADRRDGPGGAGRRSRPDRGAARRRRRDPADQPRPDRRRAAGGSDRGAGRGAGRGGRHARGAGRRPAASAAVSAGPGRVPG